MATSDSDSKIVQIVSCDSENETISLNEDALREILTSDEIKNKYVSIISVTGDFRQGKSFLLNFFLRYLRVKYLEKRPVSDWLTSEDGKLGEKGFSWISGSKRHTTGIFMSSEAFIAKMLTGEEVAIFLMDTQGSFDYKSSMDDCAKIFALSTLISSVQIYNVMRNIKQYDLTHLQCFGGYGNLFTDSGNLPPFQNLCFLVRDWPYADEHPYGEVGGQTYLEDAWQSNREEVKADVDNVKQLFEKISCFLLPHPGRAVDGSKKFDGDLKDIDDEFVQHVQDLVTTFLSVDNLVLKTVSGEKVKAGDLMCFIEEYSKILTDGTLPKVETVFQATVEAHHRVAKSKAFKNYMKNMDVDVKYYPRFYTESMLYEQHHKNKEKSIRYYSDLKKYDNGKLFEKYLLLLKNEMDEEYKKYKTINDEKRLRHEAKKREAEENKRRQLERVRRIQQDQNQPGGSGLSSLASPEAIGTAVAVVGGIAALGFGLAKAFSSNKNND